MYSINGDGDMAALSPYPLLNTIPFSQPVAKIYLENKADFRRHLWQLELSLMMQKVFRSSASSATASRQVFLPGKCSPSMLSTWS